MGKVFALWLDSKTRLGPSTRDTYESRFRRRVEPVLGAKPINVRTSTDLRLLMPGWQEQGLAIQTILNGYNLLSPFFPGGDGLVQCPGCGSVEPRDKYPHIGRFAAQERSA